MAWTSPPVSAKRFATSRNVSHETSSLAAITSSGSTTPTEVSNASSTHARLIAMACSQPPEGFSRWSLRLLEKHVALVDDIPDLDHSTIGRVLKKRNFVLI